ncbi:21193_t:CDS:2, partial [Entrophospora sp. SA101]
MSDYFLSHEEEVLETDQGYIIKLRLLSKRFFTKQSAEFPENYKFRIEGFLDSVYYQRIQSLIREWKSQVDQTIKIIEPSQTIDFLKKENEKLRNRELNANEKKMVAFRSTIPDSGDLNMRMEAANRMLTELEENDLSTQANPNLAAEGLYSRETNELNQQITELEKRIEELNSTILLPNQSHDFSTLQTEIKRLKIQDLTIQIPLKKQELEQLINNLKSELSEAGKYLLD